MILMRLFSLYKILMSILSAKKSYFFPILGGRARRVRPPLDPPLHSTCRTVVINEVSVFLISNSCAVVDPPPPLGEAIFIT
jgi:hypothetical protein